MKEIIKKGFPYGIVIILLMIASVYDYEINVMMAHRLAGIDLFFERFMILPILVLLITCFQLYQMRTYQHRFLICSMIASIYAGFDTMQYWYDGTFLYIISLLFACGLWLFIRFIVKQIPIYQQEEIAHWFMYFTMVLLLSMLATTILKQVWGRVRFREGNGLFDFTPWYMPQGINGHHSFPSGHTTAFTSILTLLHLPKSKQLPFYLRWMIVFLVILMPLTRMSCGAHYLSDTLVGFSITYSIYLIMTKIYQKRRIL